MLHRWQPLLFAPVAALFALAAGAPPDDAARPPASIAWTGRGAYRIVVSVPPVSPGARQHDQLVASLTVDMAAELAASGIDGGFDPASLQVHRIDPRTGQAQPYAPLASPISPFDRPARFDDEEASATQRHRVGRASETPDGRSAPIARRAAARLFNREVGTTRGHIVWTHDQNGSETAWYAIYFDVQRPARPYGRSPAPWIGDVDVLRSAEGAPLGGFSHFTATAGDFDGDGLFDLVAGMEKGQLVWFQNHGTPGHPRFIGSRFVTDEDGPIDTGWYGAPFLFDWDADGRVDLLVGTSGNVILWWKNVGDKTAPRLSYRGFVQADGGRLSVPERPVDEDPAGVFKHDYYNQPWVGDWDGDGLPDIVTGGYTTGRVFLYRGTGRGADGVPTLTRASEIQADGKPVDTTWGAAPFAFDVDGDGDLDLVSGSWWWSGIRTPPPAGATDLVFYYENTGSRRAPVLTRRPLPRRGAFPNGTLARPTVVDWNADGLPDLLVSDNEGATYVFLNVGTSTAPQWDVTGRPLSAPWGFTKDVDLTQSWADLDADGQLETLNGNRISRRSAAIHAPTITPAGVATVNGAPIAHAGPGYGDPYGYSTLADWDGDGRADVLWGTQQGEVFVHRNRGVRGAFAFDPGVRLMLTTGEPLRVGPPVVGDPSQVKDFTVLQGSRIVFVATDFDGDGIQDLVVTDTYRDLWVFLNTKAGGTNTLRPGVKVAKAETQIEMMTAVDLNHDGRPDLLTGGTAAKPGLVYMNTSASGRPAVAPPTSPIDLPYVFWGPRLRSIDWNGDGDEDLLIRSEFFSFWVEGSFLAHGYRQAQPILDPKGRPVQRRPQG